MTRQIVAERPARGRAHTTPGMLPKSPATRAVSVDGVNSRPRGRARSNALYVPVVSSTGKPLMPCHPAKARELVRAGRALRRFDRGLFYIRLLDRTDGDTQPIAVGIDPGSKKEGLTVKSAAHTYLNIQADAVTWVKDAIEVRRNMRGARRFRKTPCRPNRENRARGQLAPSTRARWAWKLRLARWLARRFPISQFIVEDVAAKSYPGMRRWNSSFSPLEVGKRWFYAELKTIAPVETKSGWETKELRDAHRLKKTTQKMADRFDAHCVDSWVLANSWTGGHVTPDNERMLLVTPLRFHRRQLHALQPAVGGIRRNYGGTLSLGLKRGGLVKHPRYGLTYVGGTMGQRISLHSLDTGSRLCQNAKPGDCAFMAHNTWRARFISGMNTGVSIATT